MSIKTYSELITFQTFEERFAYLKLNGSVGEETFGFQRWANQELYHSRKWKRFKDEIIIRDNGRDLGTEGYEIYGHIYIHHLNPITYEDIINQHPCVFDPENVVCVSFRTHNAIHYGHESLLGMGLVHRGMNDTCPWKNK